MGNCQAIDAATLVIQHPSGKVDKLFWPISASEVMRMNPGHYVALLISTTLCPPPHPPSSHAPNNSNNVSELPSSTTTTSKNTNNPKHNSGDNSGPIRLTKIKLLKPNDTLLLGHSYRLITTQEVMKGLKAKKQAKVRSTGQVELEGEEWVKEKRNHGSREEEARRRTQLDKENQVINRNEGSRPRTTTTSNNSATARPRTWQPSLNSISEAAS